MSKKHQILVVDNEESITYCVKTSEDLPEFEVDTALSGSHAINLVRSRVYDVSCLMSKCRASAALKFLDMLNTCTNYSSHNTYECR